MSNQANGFQGSQPFITDKQYQNLPLDQLKYILEEKKKRFQKDSKELEEKQKIIRGIRKLDKFSEKVKQGIDVVKERKERKERKLKKIKSFDDYFEECIKNKEITKDTPTYFREALERAIKEHDQGLIKEKSALDDFANKYVIDGEAGMTPVAFFNRYYGLLEEFFTYHRNTKFSMVLVCMMEQQILGKKREIIELKEDKAYFRTGVYKNLESTDVEKLIRRCFKKIVQEIGTYQKNGSGWYFKEVVQLEIHTVEFNPNKGSSYIPLPNWILNKKAIVNIQNKDEKCFLWCILRYFYPRDSHEERLTDLKKYEFSLNTKGIDFPMKLKDISKFEKLNPSLLGINVFSVNDSKEFYPLRMAERDCLNTIDLSRRRWCFTLYTN